MRFKPLTSFVIALSILLTILTGKVLLAQGIVTVQVDNRPPGISTRYIGAVEGNLNFDIKDLQDLGINTYRIYGGMSRWEAEDDDQVYGWPSITEIKANPNIINWTWWDTVMTNPPNSSDYWWSGKLGTTWQGNARTIFSTLKQANIKPILTIRNTDNSWNPSWALQLNPPRTAEDWNEWWEHVFATVYWLNVRNDYQVNDFQIHNEPDNREQGWGGTQADYFELVRVTKDAIDYVYKTYLPGRSYHIHAPVTVGESLWPLKVLQAIPTSFDSIDIHDYSSDIADYTQRVRSWMKATRHAESPIWLSEWGSYQNEYNSISFAINLIQNAIRASQAGNSYIYGSHVFSLYDWGRESQFEGLIGVEGKRRASYYALRMSIRALQGGRPTFSVSTNNPNLMAIATKDLADKFYLLVTNSGKESYTVNANLSTHMMIGTGTVWEFSSQVMDEVVGDLKLNQGHVSLKIPSKTAMLLQFKAKD